MKDNFTKRTKPSRQTSYESLLGFIGCIFATKREEFEYYYTLATHDKGGEGWARMQRVKKNIQ